MRIFRTGLCEYRFHHFVLCPVIDNKEKGREEGKLKHTASLLESGALPRLEKLINLSLRPIEVDSDIDTVN